MRSRLKALGVAVFVVGLVGGLLGVAPRQAAAAELPLRDPGCGSTIKKSFRLSTDLFCDNTAMFVKKSNITIDLNGHEVTGLDGDSTAVQNGSDGLTLKNGVVRHFQFGVQMVDAKNAVVSNVVAVDNTSTGFRVLGPGHTFKKNVAVANGQHGFSVEGRNSTFAGNRTANNQTGFIVTGRDNTLRSNVVAGNTSTGVVIFGDGNDVIKNKVTGNGHVGNSPGVLMDDASEGNLTKGNTIVGNADDGYRDDGTKNSAVANKAYGNGYLDGVASGVGTGIDASAATNPKGSKNVSLGNDAATQCVSASLCKTIKGDPDLVELEPDCGDPVSISFRLKADMLCENSDALKVVGEGITIDLAGHTIKGDGDDVGIVNDNTVIASGKDDVTIRNGVIRNFNIGINMNGVDRGEVIDVVAVDNDTGIFFDGNDNAVRKSFASANAGGITFAHADLGEVVSSTASNNTNGLAVTDTSSGVRVELNNFSGNSSKGASILGPSDIFRNTFAGNGVGGGEVGLSADGVGGVVERNLFFGNGGTGYVDNGGGTAINKNSSYANGFLDGIPNGQGIGIDASGVAFVSGTDNVARGNDDNLDECLPASLCPVP